MKVDFTKPLMNFKGEIMTDHKGQNVFIKDIVASALSGVTEASKEDKQKLAILAEKVWLAKEAMEVSPEEAVTIRKNIEHLPAHMFNAIYNLLG